MKHFLSIFISLQFVYYIYFLFISFFVMLSSYINIGGKNVTINVI